MNSKRKKELIQGLLKNLNERYSSYSFKLQKTKGSFQKGEFTVHWNNIVVYFNSLHFQPSLSVNNKDVLRVLNNLFPQAKNLTIYKVQGSELAQEIGLFEDYKEEEMFYKVESNDDFENIVTDHMMFMEKVGFNFFKNFNTLQGVNDFINCRVLNGDREFFESEDQKIALKKFFDKREVLSGVISAYLISNPEMDELLNRYRILFEGNDYILDDVKKIEDYFTQEA
jgi:hypothetical protein